MAKIDRESTVKRGEANILGDDKSIARGRQFVPLLPMTVLDVHEPHDLPAPNYSTSPDEIPVPYDLRFGMVQEI